MLLGVLGGGQLGRMLALAGYPLGVRCRFLDPAGDAPAGQVAELLVADYTDADARERFRVGLDAVTYEFESIPADATRSLARQLPVYPPPEALEAAQDRLTEKKLFQRLGIPTPAFAAVDDQADLWHALDRIGFPAVVKTRRFGYDGKGQYVLREPRDVSAVWENPRPAPLLVESLIEFERELSILSVRGRGGEIKVYPLVENHHRHGILRLSLAPAVDPALHLQQQAARYARRLLEALDYVGVLAVEFFQFEGRLLANEMAPRVHNSGHWTIEGAETSQFENHLRAVLGMPLGSTAAVGHSAMLNLIGTVPAVERLLSIPGAHVHLYGKADAPGRKVGHVTLRNSTDPGELQSRLALLGSLTDLE